MRMLLWIPVLLTGCTSPETADLVGTWANQDGTTWRVWNYMAVGDAEELTGVPNAYVLYLYEDGAAPTAVQRGTYAVAHDVDVNTPQGTAPFNDVLTSTATWSIDGMDVGVQFGDPIYAFTPEHMTLRSATATSGKRRYDKVDALP